MDMIILIGVIYFLSDGNWLGCLVFLGIASMLSDRFTDSNRRGEWWK